MGKLLFCGICCMLISGWGIVQLILMGFLFFFEAPILFDEAKPSSYTNYDDLIEKTKENYHTVAINCWIAAVGYVITLIISFWCIKKANADTAKAAKLLEDDEYICNPPPLPTRNKEKGAKPKKRKREKSPKGSPKSKKKRKESKPKKKK